MIALVNDLKLIRSKNIIFAVVASALLAACSNNAPAPVYDATLAQRVQQGLNSSSNSQIQIARNRQAQFQSNKFRQDSGQAKISETESGLAIADISRSVPIKEHTSYSSKKSTQHKVKPGETLYSIAWQHSLDHRELAKFNKIQAGKIYPGMILELKQKSNNSISRSKLFNRSSLVASLDKEILNRAKSSIKTNKKQSIQKTKVSSANNKRSLNTNQPVKNWLWPVNGKVIRHFSNRSNSNKGVDIAAKHGDPVRATANGKVVYSGSGLRGYGQLVIIKHNDLFLSAYAHNDKVHVKENEFVKAGQKIADLGSSDSDKEKLHFEIRYKGKPVDPLNYLPKSG